MRLHCISALPLLNDHERIWSNPRQRFWAARDVYYGIVLHAATLQSDRV